MGQEISQQKKCSIISRHKTHQQTPQSLQPQPQRGATKNLKPSTNFTTSNGKYTRHSQEFQSVYAPSSNISTTSSSSTDDEHYRLRQKYNLNKQTYEKFRASKKLSLISSTTDQSTSTSNSSSTNSSSSTYQNSKSSEPTYNNIVRKPSQHKRKNSSSTDSGIYYASCHCTSSVLSSSATSSSSLCSTSACGCSTSSNQSRSSLDQKKNYLCKHLYIKSYLDILEEDEKAHAHFKSAKPGGIRNYKPKILGETALSTSAPQSTGFSISSNNLKLREKCKEDPWI